MDEITMFATLRPIEPPLDRRDREALRTELFGAPITIDDTPHQTLVHDGRVIALDRVVAGRDDRVGWARLNGRRRWVTLAAAAVTVLGVGGLVAVESDRDVDAPPAPSARPEPLRGEDLPSVTPPADEYAVPLIAIDQPGWTLTYSTESDMGRGGPVVFGSAEGFDGAWVRFEIAHGDDMSYGEEQPIALGSLAGITSSVGDLTIVKWTNEAGDQLVAFGWRLSAQQIAELAATVTVQGSEVVVPNLRGGFTVAAPEAAAALNRYAEYQFTNEDGRTIQISFYPGAGQGLNSRIANEERTTVTIGEESVSLLDYAEGGRYRVNTQRGFWTWEFNSELFASQDDFMALIAAVRTVDAATWQASLPDNIVGTTDRPAVIAELLADIPLRPDFDVETLSNIDSTQERYQLIVEVSGAVGCDWLDLWFEGEEARDPTMQAEAAAALATSHDWPMLIEANALGGWSEEFWRHADAVNGGEGVMTGAGPVAPYREEAEGALGCQFD